MSNEAGAGIGVEAKSRREGGARFALGERARPVLRWLLFLFLVLVLCPVQYWAPSGNTVDNSWFFALSYAAAHHFVLGRDVAWTFGPLAYLFIPLDVGHSLIQGLVFQGALWLLLVAVLADVFFRCGFALWNLAAFAILIGLSTLDYRLPYWGTLLLCPPFLLLVCSRLRGGLWRQISGLAIIGLMPLFDLVGSMIAAGAILGLALNLLLSGRRAARTDVALAAAVPLSVAIVGLRLGLGSFGAVAKYLRWTLALIRGYSVAMSSSGPRMELIAAAEAVTLIAALLFLLMLRDKDDARFYALFLAIPLFVNVKHGFTRQDAPHFVVVFCFFALVLALIALGIPFREKAMASGALTVLLVFGVLWQDYVPRDDPKAALASITGVQTLRVVWDALHFERLRRSLDAEGRENYSRTGIEPEIKSIIGHERVAFLSDVYSDALVEGLNLDLLPVLQAYSAYTPYLDQLNANWIDHKGPRFLIFDGSAIDGRHPWTQTPATWAEVYRWYCTRFVGDRNLLLERRREARFRRFEPLPRRKLEFGQELAMPRSQEPVFWSMRCSLSTTGKLRALLLRVPPVMMDVSRTDGRTESFRVIVPVLGAPSLGNYLPSNLLEFAGVFRDPPVRDFPVTKLRFRSMGRSAYQRACEVEFLRAVH